MISKKDLDASDIESTLDQSIGDCQSSRFEGLRSMFVFENSKVDSYKAEAERLLKKHGTDSQMAAGAAARVAGSKQFAGDLKTHISAADAPVAAGSKKPAAKATAPKNPESPATKTAKPVETKEPQKKTGK